MITAVGVLGSALATGTASALLPVVSAEAFERLMVGRPGPVPAWGLVLALAIGQTAGKLALFESARRGSGAWLGRLHRGGPHPARRSSRWGDRVSVCLRSRRTGPAVVLASATLGLPPLAVVSLAAGAAGQRRLVFGLTCLVGRTARFAVIAAPVVLAYR
jgi:membrane protein YqaA with SNARE-associated domain